MHGSVRHDVTRILQVGVREHVGASEMEAWGEGKKLQQASKDTKESSLQVNIKVKSANTL